MTVKIVIACGQTVFVFLISWVIWRYFGLRRESDENWKWTLFSVVVGVHDFVSDLTTLSLIPIQNPFYLFWVSVGSILCSTITSLVLSSSSSIKLSWSARAFIFISGTAEDFGHERPEKWNSRTLLCVESLPQILVQSILVYLQGSQGFTGWDWAIWMQSVAFTLAGVYKHLRKVWKNGCGQTTDQPSTRDNVQMSDILVTGVGVLIPAVGAVTRL